MFASIVKQGNLFNLAASTTARMAARSSTASTLHLQFGSQNRSYAGGRPSKEEFEKRAIEVLKGFDKIDAAKLNLDAHFNKDLGLDSLDTVEVLMAIEDEFMIEIPDEEADGMSNLRDAVGFVYERWTPEHYM